MVDIFKNYLDLKNNKLDKPRGNSKRYFRISQNTKISYYKTSLNTFYRYSKRE